MEYKVCHSKIVMRLDTGDEVIQSVQHVCRERHISLGTVTGIGAVKKATIGYFEQDAKVYHTREFVGDIEVTSLQGNITEMNDDVYLHLHATLSDSNYNAYGGHLNEAWVGPTFEIFIDIIDGKVSREKNSDVGLNTLMF